MGHSKKILMIGKSGRLDCCVDAIFRSRHEKEIFVLSEVSNKALEKKARVRKVERTDDKETVLSYAKEVQPDFAFIAPEEPLAAGIVDALATIGVPSVGPTKNLARLESSKSFTRKLLQKYNIRGNPKFRIFSDHDGLRPYLENEGSFVVKPDGLTSGKGVKVFGEHLQSIADSIEYCDELFKCGNGNVIIEEKLDGEEFSYQSFFDGYHIVHTLPVQDHKRAKEDDLGPNTGGMGSYSCEDHLLPFLTADQIDEARQINTEVANALFKETGERYKGILYGGFMATKHGIRVIEYNARFGDPEVMNVLPLLEGDFIDICEAIIGGTLDQVSVGFKQKASVCKYVVPEDYPTNPVRNKKIDTTKLPTNNENLRVFYGAVNSKGGDLYLTGSRALAIVGIGKNLQEAEQIAESAASTIQGPVFHRSDIGTSDLIAKRVNHMRTIRADGSRSVSISNGELNYAV